MGLIDAGYIDIESVTLRADSDEEDTQRIRDLLRKGIVPYFYDDDKTAVRPNIFTRHGTFYGEMEISRAIAKLVIPSLYGHLPEYPEGAKEIVEADARGDFREAQRV